MLELDKIRSKTIAKFRWLIQILASLMTNIHLPNFLKGVIYRGNIKKICVPGLNCYSCPAATGACPIGAYQAVVGSSKFKFSYYISGFLIFVGVMVGRLVCGFLCPFGFIQEILHKIPCKKFSTKKLKPLRYIKYLILVVAVIILPVLVVNELGMGNPYFCKYICPAGVLEGAIPLSLVDTSIRASLGSLFNLKLTILIITVILSIIFFRPFCKWICPLGAFYALFNKISLFKINFDNKKCISCKKCVKACKMDVDVRKDQNHTECIRCGMCITSCPTCALKYQFGLDKKKEENKKENLKEDIKGEKNEI